jgi:Xylose isomerase-like TIM barrel
MSYLAVSSFSLHSELGPLGVEQRQANGDLCKHSINFPRHYSLEEFAALAKQRVGVQAIELCQIQFDSQQPARIERLRASLDESGVTMLALPIDIGDLGQANPAWRADDEARILPWFDIAHTLGATFVRVNAGAPGTGIAKGVEHELVDALRRLGDAAAAKGLKLLVENHGGTSSDPEFLLRLRERVGPDRLGILLDLGNFEPLASLSRGRITNPALQVADLNLEPIYRDIALIAPVASLVHAKLIDPAKDGTPLPDLERALSIVAQSGYSDSISIEWEGRSLDPWERTTTIARQVRASFPQLR